MNEHFVNPIVEHYESCLAKYGDSHLGVDWPKLEDAEKRYAVMLELLQFSKAKKKSCTLLDLGCGAGHLLEFIRKSDVIGIEYSGVDLSPKFVALCQQKFPGVNFFQLDVLKEAKQLGYPDFIVMNGVFTEKLSLSFDEMWAYCQDMLKTVFKQCAVGMAFNVMSKHVDWERDDLFHLPHDLLASFIIKNLGRNFIIRNDYGLYEYTVYVYK